MDYTLTEHARKRCIRRKIKSIWIQNALDHPLRLETDPEDDSLIHALWPVPEKGFRSLRVIYNETTVPVAVVTAYFENEAIKP
jgi:hypothetical protein